ncbi:citrate/2-methylcitrate synthase [Roseomonas populi]|uniref:Citrate synthase n=1 Tax=Roseomonas populi TaxID=3121582 RepID=A0ABT1XB92_9PROT|nr:citrate/2-methylcitrate synthase [Roseomonas pecuniae]MCR0984969.1 citrate synthase [Roseomonas pecuniae]
MIHLVNMQEWLDRADALRVLGVKAQTLYAYVSRGMIEARRDPGGRHSLYRSEDVAALTGKRQRSRKPSMIAEGSMAWGEPSVTTTICTVDRGRLIYRGADAVALSRDATLEEIADLLWESSDGGTFDVPSLTPTTPFLALAALMPGSEASAGRVRELLCRDARVAVSHLAAACGVPPGTAALHEGLAHLWSLDAGQADLVRQALVLLADHELNASTFATRVAASTGAPIAACMLAGLSALSGPRHGGASTALLRLIDEAARAGPREAVQRRLDRDGFLPGFGHPLYPNGDVRALALIGRQPLDPLMRELQDCALDATGTLPNIDFALTVLARAAGLPRNAPFTVFLLGRSVGWAAHAMEQARHERLIRPRARYEGRKLPDAGQPS